jgi:hypothetical protein
MHLLWQPDKTLITEGTTSSELRFLVLQNTRSTCYVMSVEFEVIVTANVCVGRGDNAPGTLSLLPLSVAT